MTTGESSLYELMPGTDAEKNLAEDFAALIDKLSALTGAVEGGSWRYATEKVESVRRALSDVERRIGYAAEAGADSRRVEQLITAFAQSYGGFLGPRAFPVSGLENAAARDKIVREKEWRAQFRAAMDAGDEAAASELAGGTVRIVSGMTSDTDH